MQAVHVYWSSQLRIHIANATIDGHPYTILIEGPETAAALNGKAVTPSESASDIEVALMAGRYTLQRNHEELDCIDMDVRPDRLLYAVPK
jgi:hypothetical protein